MNFPRTFILVAAFASLLAACAPTYHASETTHFDAAAKDAIVVLGITSTKPYPGLLGLSRRLHRQFWVSWTAQPTGHIRYYTDDVIEAKFFQTLAKTETEEITQYRVLRVPAGTYYLRYLESGDQYKNQFRYIFRPDGELLYFTAGPGEAIYIGDLICDASGGAPQLVGIRRHDDQMIAAMADFPNIDRKPVYHALRRYGTPKP